VPRKYFLHCQNAVAALLHAHHQYEEPWLAQYDKEVRFACAGDGVVQKLQKDVL
jgi:hypothetical protein